ncbi:MAG: transporter [Desulfobacter sp.]
MTRFSSSKVAGVFLFLTLIVVLSTSGPVFASLSHYTPGGFGIRNATMPPPGLWFIDYSQFYDSDSYKGDNGNTSDTTDVDLSLFINVNLLTWITEKKFLGADYGMSVFVLLLNTDLNVNVMGFTTTDDQRFGFGDIFIDPLVLAWHGNRWDAFLSSGAYLPTGDHDKPASPGKGYWTFMHQAGGTVYFDAAKTWTASVRGRFLHSTEDQDTDIRPGNEAIFEYGLGKDIPLKNGSVLTAGVAGYSYIQLTKDSGPEASNLKAEGHAVGPELQLTLFKPFFLNVSLRYIQEYEVKNNTKGDSFCLTFATCF